MVYSIKTDKIKIIIKIIKSSQLLHNNAMLNFCVYLSTFLHIFKCWYDFKIYSNNIVFFLDYKKQVVLDETYLRIWWELIKKMKKNVIIILYYVIGY